MASAVGHDLRNPLGAIQNALYLQRHSLGADVTEEQGRYFQMAGREIAKASAIIEHLGSFVRPAEPVIAPVELRSLIDEILEIAPARQDIEVRTELDAITLQADRDQLAEILTNLVNNAYDAMGTRGSLHVRALIEGDVANIEVEDTGPGMDRSQAERIFEPFFTTKRSGTGLGLAIVRRLVEAHGGTVGVESITSKGTKFCVRLPRAQPAPSMGSGSSPASEDEVPDAAAAHVGRRLPR